MSFSWRATRTPVLTLVLSAVVAIPFVILFSMNYVTNEDPVYVWDYGNYWKKYQQYGAMILATDWRWLSSAAAEVWISDYNSVAAIMLCPAYLLFGGSRAVYLAADAALFLVPAVALTAWLSLVVARTGDRATETTDIVAAFLLALLFTPLWGPTLRGMVDVIGLVPMAIATLVVFRSRLVSPKDFAHPVLIGLSLWAAFLLRRWYAYSILVTFALYFAWLTLSVIRAGGPFGDVVKAGLTVALSGLVFLGLAAATQGGLLQRALTVNYSDLYAAYQAPFLSHLRRLAGSLSWFTFALIALGLAAAIVRRSWEAIFCALAAALTFLAFTRTQSMGPHHFLPVAFWLFPVVFLGVRFLVEQMRFGPLWARYAPFVVVAAVAFALTFVIRIETPGPLQSVFLTSQRTYPLRLENLAEYRRLIADLQAKVQQPDRFVVFASSIRLADELLVTLEPALAPRVIRAPHNAARDLFTFEMLRAGYAVVVDPPQTHQAPNAQQNLTIPGQMILSGEGFGAAYAKEGNDYALAGGATASLYRRTRPVTLPEMQDLVTRFVAYYPTWRALFNTTMAIPIAARTEVLGDKYGGVFATGRDGLLIHPGATTPTGVQLVLPPEIAPAAMQVSTRLPAAGTCPGADGIDIMVKADQATLATQHIAPGGQQTIDLPAGAGLLFITIDKGTTPTCDLTSIAFRF